MLRLADLRILLVLPLMLAVVGAVRASAQDDPNEIPLGDLARSLRKKSATVQPVIDDDNLPQVMEQAESRRGSGSALRFLMAGEANGFRVSAPDVTCSLAFTPNVKSLLSRQYAQMDLPDELVSKLEGKATIEGDTFTLPVFNGTDWHVSEVDVALTVVGKAGIRNALDIGEPLAGSEDDGSAMGADPLEQVRPEKKRDSAVVYRMRAASPPWGRAVFSAPLELDLQPGEEWHWAIVQAKGYPPESYAGATQQSAAQRESPQFVHPSAVALPAPPPGASLSQNPQ